MKSASRLKYRLHVLRIILIAIPIAYIASYGLTLRYMVWQGLPDDASYRVLRFYQPLCRVMPRSLMVNYSVACGLTDIEAFFFLQVMASDRPVSPPAGNVSFEQDFDPV